jgi:hypothetical protein
MQHARALLGALVAATLAASLSPPAQAAKLLVRDVTNAQLRLAGSDRAIVSYQEGGVARRAELSGSGDWAELGVTYAAHRAGAGCTRYSGPALPLLVAACDASDGSYWALQVWERLVPNYGGRSAPLELYVSHWSGEPGALEVHTDWA